MRFAAFLACLGLLAAPVYAAGPVSGRYGPLLLAVDQGAVSGAYVEARGGQGGPTFSCVFLFAGTLRAGKADVTVIQPAPGDTLHGTLAQADGDAVTLQLDANGDGCAMTAGDMVTQPYRLDLDTRQPAWKAVALVSAQQAVLQKGPARDPQRRKPYLVQYDGVAVLQKQGDWVRVEFVGSEKPVTGWMPASALMAAPKPR